LRQEWVAAQLGLTPDRFNHILEGRRPVPEPRDEFYATLAVLLGVRLADVREPVVQPEPEGAAA
jgi:Helix-turn-helix domain